MLPCPPSLQGIRPFVYLPRPPPQSVSTSPNQSPPPPPHTHTHRHAPFSTFRPLPPPPHSSPPSPSHPPPHRHAAPFSTFRAPSVRGGVGRHESIPWTPRDDALLLLGLYKHGYRAYDEVRDDPELPFTCRNGYARLPPPLPQPQPLEPHDSPPAGDSVPPEADFDALDLLPLSAPPDAAAAAAARAAAGQSAIAPPGFDGETGGAADEEAFLPEKEFRERARALMDALGEAEKGRDELRLREAAWEEEWDRELAGEPPVKAKPRGQVLAAGEQAWEGWYAYEVTATAGGA